MPATTDDVRVPAWVIRGLLIALVGGGGVAAAAALPAALPAAHASSEPRPPAVTVDDVRELRAELRELRGVVVDLAELRAELRGVVDRLDRLERSQRGH